jgi:guanylate kinase
VSQLVVITGPSGVGKGTLIETLRSSIAGVALATSATTRRPRVGEVDGREYHFLSVAEFDRRVAAGEFLEWAEYAGNRYGTLLDEVHSRSDNARAVLLEIEVLGAQQVRAKVDDAILVFIAPPSAEVLEQRLRSRATDSESQIELRLAQAERELAAADQFDTVIVNDDLEVAAAQLVEEVSQRLE